jgi:hypothetical protein
MSGRPYGEAVGRAAVGSSRNLLLLLLLALCNLSHKTTACSSLVVAMNCRFWRMKAESRVFQ